MIDDIKKLKLAMDTYDSGRSSLYDIIRTFNDTLPSPYTPCIDRPSRSSVDILDRLLLGWIDLHRDIEHASLYNEIYCTEQYIQRASFLLEEVD